MALEVGADGDLVVAGLTDTPSERSVVLSRLRPDGATDDTFGTDGRVTVPLGPSNAVRGTVIPAVDVALTPDGGMVVAAPVGSTAQSDAFAVARVDASGRLVWRVAHDVSGQLFHRMRLLIRTDGRVVVAGAVRAAPGFLSADVFVARLDGENGTLDGTFGASGLVLYPRTEGFRMSDARAHDLAEGAAGSILFAGETTGMYNGSPMLASFSETGVRDPVFPSDDPYVVVWDLIARPGGAFLALTGGYRGPTQVEWFSADGARERPSAVAIKDDDHFRGFAIDPKGRIVVADERVVRLLPDGRRDPGFGRRGAANPGLRAIGSPFVQPDGKIVLLGNVGEIGDPVAVTRLFGGTARTRTAIERRVTLWRRGAVVRLQCRRAGELPSCSGTVRVGKSTPASYYVAAGQRTAVRVPLARTAWRRATRAKRPVAVRVRVTNADAETVQRRVRLTQPR
jgi:uncharacterized delta-60 repeat protein